MSLKRECKREKEQGIAKETDREREGENESDSCLGSCVFEGRDEGRNGTLRDVLSLFSGS